MTDTDSEVYALLDRAADGPVGEPPTRLIVEAGGRRVRRRRASQVLAAGVATAVIVGAIFVVAGRSPGPRESPTTATVKPIAGPTAEQLAHGKWVAIPAAPKELCEPQAVWDGSDLVVIEPAAKPCQFGVVSYDPRANRWAAISAPPKAIGGQPVAAWGGGRLVLIAPTTGATFSWTPATNNWQQLGRLPMSSPPSSYGPTSLTWTGRQMLTVVVVKKVAQTYALDASNTWTRLPDLPQPAKGSIYQVSTAVHDGAVYALAGVEVQHITSNGSSTSGSVELLRLTEAGWINVPSTFGQLRGETSLTALDGSLLAGGVTCAVGCMENAEASTLLRPGSHPEAVPLHLSDNMLYSANLAAGGGAIVATGPNANLMSLALSHKAAGTTDVYDVTTGRWLVGPTAAANGHPLSGGAYWTPYGVVSLATDGGQLLRPAT